EPFLGARSEWCSNGLPSISQSSAIIGNERVLIMHFVEWSRLPRRIVKSLETVVGVRVLKPYLLDVWFSDGARRRVDVESELYGELFEPLRDPTRFSEAFVDEDLGTVVWPNGVVFSLEFLYGATSYEPASQLIVEEFVGSDGVD